MSNAADKQREVQEAELNFVDRGLTPTPIPPEKEPPPPYEEGATKVDVKQNGDKATEKDAKKVKPTNIIKLFRYTTWFDRLLILLGTLASMAHGACLPLLWLFFGSLTNTFLAQSASANISMSYEQVFNGSIDCDSVFDFPDINNMGTVVQNTTITSVLRSFNFSDDITCLLDDNFLSAIDSDILAFVYFGVGVFLVALMHISFFQITAERQVYKIRLAYYRAILRQDIAWFDVNPSGELANRLSDDIDKIHAGIGDKLAILIQWISTTITGFIVAYTQEWRLALLMTAFAPLMIISGAAIAKATAAFTSKEQKEYASAGGVAEEVLSSIRTVFAFGGEKNETDRYNCKLKQAKRIGAKKGLSVGIIIGGIFFILFSLYGVAFWFGAYLIQSHGAQGGDILAAFFTFIIAAFSLGQSAPNIESLLTAAGSAGAVYDTIDRVPTIDSSSTEGLKPDKFEPVIELKNVGFTYPARPDVQVMHDVSLKVEVGQTVALVGPSGCGKSTVVQLIQRFYDVDSGEVIVGGNNVKDWNLRWLRSHIGVVSQEPILFDASIAENIRYGKEDATMEEIEEAAKKANAHSFISSLPQGYDTSAGERGVQLSGGQKQRIAIARALLSNPKILLLDEATSALDTESEAVVQEALDVAREGRTTIVIAHRLSTIQNADVICAVNEGRVVEVGSHSDLMAEKGLYYELVNAQSFGTDENFIQTGQVGRLLSQRSVIRSVKGSSSGFERQHSVRRQVSTFSDDGAKKNLKREISTKQQEAWDKDIPAVPLHRVLALNAKEWWIIVLGVLGAGINGLVFPSFSIFFGEILRVFGLRPDMVLAAVHMWGGLFIGLGFVSGIANFVKVFCFTLSGESLTARLRALTFKAMLRQEIGWFDDDRNSTGALTTRLADDAGQVQGATGSRVGGLIETIFGLGFSIIVAFVYSWLITLVILGTVPILLIAGALQFKVLHGNAAKNKKNVEEAGKIAVDSIDNIRTVASLTIEDNFFEQYKVHIKGPYLRSILVNPFVYGLIYGFSQGVLFFMFAIVFRFGAFLVNLPTDHSLHVEYENVFRVFIAITFGAISIGQASAFAPNYAKAKLSANRIFALLDRVPLIDNYSEDGEKLENVQGTIAVKDVRFTYPARPDVEVLQGMNIELQPGKTLALVGPSGCGKSTVVSLIERFYDPSAGSLTLEGIDLRDLNLNWLRSQIGIVSQEPVLFDCSIAENIRYGALFREVSDEEVIEAAKSANIHSFIESLPEGYNTKVGSKGTQLSGGQKQRVAIARALVRDPKVLLLDEATSALDTESEKIVQEALDKAREGRTSIVIAHRLSTVFNSDCIAVIQGGKVLEKGTHSELLSMKGLYYKLNRFQMVESEDGGDSVF